MSDSDTLNPEGGGPSDIRPVSITEELSRSYLDYAMSVIVSRALPDVRDGLKPVHRRILFSMRENNYTPERPYNKSARVTGDTMGKYHPHGNQAIYDALVRLAQEFSMRLPLIDGQGNFGSVDGDPPAAERYTEVRLAKPAMNLLDDLDKDTVDFQDNYDGREQEPTVLPARFPNLLVNGAGGIAVGMATNIPPHNLGEVVDACVALIDDPALDVERLLDHIHGPDFPTGALILGRSGIRQAYLTGRGSIVMRSRATIEEIRKDRDAIIVTEIPYQVNKATMIERIAELVREKRLEGIAEIRDESSREGMRVVFEIKRDAQADVVLNNLYRMTSLQTSFGANMVALNGGKPALMNLLDLLTAFVAFREDVVSRRTKFLLRKARDRAHVLVGLAIAVANIDEIIHTIRTSPDPATAREALMTRHWPAMDVAPLIALIDDPRHRLAEDGTYRLSAEQARAILDLRLQRLTALGRDEVADELDKIAVEIREYLDILASRERIRTIVKDELLAVKAEFGTPRKTEIAEAEGDFEDEDLIAREDMVVTVSHAGYVKRVPLSTYRAQRRGGKGRSAMQTKDEDFVTRLFVASTHAPVLFFSSKGQVYKLKVWRLPVAAPQSRGKALVNILPLTEGERITSIMALPDEGAWSRLQIMFATNSGTVRRNELSDFTNVNRNGKIAMKLEAGESIAGVQLCTEADDVLLTSARGQCIRFPTTEVRVFKGRDSMGVRGIQLEEGDRLISMAIIRHVTATAEERAAYIKLANAIRRSQNGVESNGEEADLAEVEIVEAEIAESEAGEAAAAPAEIDQARYVAMGAAEQFILTLSENGYGKRTSSYEYRTTRRGGKGIVAMAVNHRNGPLVASFPVEEADQIMLVTDGGQLIRCPVNGIRTVGRGSQGVIVFDTAEDEKVVSVERVSEDEDEGALGAEGLASEDGGEEAAG
ncbi:DNA gyrase subunit A [Ancylobacter dichloromethanicus]|uniref:DNA gyrase subunit A n=1 Tax=Ancylobacter dichloromethanicus TaxID=518825 RepID=A0A9W6J968_9HYPH|nr:DNA gyrase subunit A [Ancylobacter dichloromethanicus]MBS7554484.1 DNA gyrase subunit A [Ancylobacter dichloromethanicus]GLK71614.1 DNA gyrase subunit A [Ancylobacter dichloromethanicus]